MSCAEGVGQGLAAAGPRGGAHVLNLDALIFWQRVIDETDPLEAPAAPPPTGQHLVLRVGSANVLTLHPAQEHLQDGEWLPSARRAALARQFREAELSIIGVQEGRARTSSRRSVEGFRVWATAAEPNGAGGVELWVREAVCLPERATVVHADSSRLILSLPVRGYVREFCVLHAPSAADGGALRAEAWWRNTCAIMARHCRRPRERVVFIDANGRLGAAECPHVGAQAKPDFDDNGAALLELMLEWGLCAPATFEEAPLTTWTGRRGHTHEIDFVLLPLE